MAEVEQRERRSVSVPPRRPGFAPTVAAALATFGVLFEFLALQLTSGHDPAVGGVKPLAAQAPPRPRIIRTRIVTDVLPGRGAGSSSLPVAGAANAGSAASSGGGSSVASSTSAPAAAPAPAPAPAPVVTTAS